MPGWWPSFAARPPPMAKLRRDKLCRWRRQWSVVTLSALALVLYNAAANVWLLRPHTCPEPPPPVHTATSACEPCAESQAPTLDHDPLATLHLRLGRWDGSRSYRLFDYVALGDTYGELSASRRVCLATQSSIERLHELLPIAAHWSGPISVAVFVAGDELRSLRAFAVWLRRCRPDVYTRLAVHAATPVERPFVPGPISAWALDCGSRPLPPGERHTDTVAWRARHPYPQNHLRNLARRNCHTPYVFLVDVDIVPSRGMAEALDAFLEHAPHCPMCAYVVPTYELDRRVALFPANKSELLRLAGKKLAVPFHRKVFIYNQYASNFRAGGGRRWEASGGNESSEAHVSHNVTNFELLYEPFYVAPDNVPAHDERFLGYGFTRNTQVGTRNHSGVTNALPFLGKNRMFDGGGSVAMKGGVCDAGESRNLIEISDNLPTRQGIELVTSMNLRGKLPTFDDITKRAVIRGRAWRVAARPPRERYQ
ncbi:Beta-1,4-glucuronyltransferase 1 [Eumeta japonica]|uniref:Beta-1,4-glucuronyltransferase 1 n=1 Tax=Eumeta variegata TaxID=151549 RepID=A0A4C1ZNR9_EUMVA|nr:Beta-1,4-glucuronyltransferase 1 [Eumeta japonica]